MLASSFSLILGLSALDSPAVAQAATAPSRTGPARMQKVVVREDWGSLDHCPGGSIGDADKCTLELTTVYDKTLARWTQYGAWYDACNTNNLGTITQTVTDSLAVGNSITIGTDISIGIASEGLSLGVSQSFSQSWSTTRTFTAAQSISVAPGQVGSINLNKRFFVAEGRVRINYGKTKGEHYVWYSPSQTIYTLDPSSSDVYSSNVLACPASAPGKGAWFYSVAEWDEVRAGPKKEYTYEL